MFLSLTLWKWMHCPEDLLWCCILTQSLFRSDSVNNAPATDLHVCVGTPYKKLGKLRLWGSIDGSNIPQLLQYESSFHIKICASLPTCTLQPARMKTNTMITALNKINSEESLLSSWLTVTPVVCSRRHQGRSWLCKSQRCHLIFPMFGLGKKAQ